MCTQILIFLRILILKRKDVILKTVRFMEYS